MVDGLRSGCRVSICRARAESLGFWSVAPCDCIVTAESNVQVGYCGL